MGIDAADYLRHLKNDGQRITEVTKGNLDAEVPTCPGNTVSSLLVHTGAVATFWLDALARNAQPDPDWGSMPTDPEEAHRVQHGKLVEALQARDPSSPQWTWAGPGETIFAYRRMAQEFAVHRYDFENAVGDPRPIDPELAWDGIDELLDVFGRARPGEDWVSAAEKFGGGGETFTLIASDLNRSITFKALPHHFAYFEGDADVTATGTASDLLLVLWGRIPPERLKVEGDATLLERWQRDVKI